MKAKRTYLKHRGGGTTTRDTTTTTRTRHSLATPQHCLSPSCLPPRSLSCDLSYLVPPEKPHRTKLRHTSLPRPQFFYPIDAYRTVPHHEPKSSSNLNVSWSCPSNCSPRRATKTDRRDKETTGTAFLLGCSRFTLARVN